MGVGSYWNPKCPSQAKVCQFYGTLLVNEQVLGLQITMDDPSRMTEYGALENLVRIALTG